MGAARIFFKYIFFAKYKLGSEQLTQKAFQFQSVVQQ